MKNAHGFTLVELLITVLVAALLMALAIPAFHGFVENNRVIASTNELSSALAVARNAAIHRRDTVTLCSSADLATCAASASWGTGWIAFTDRNGNATIDGTDVLLRVWEAIPAGHTITATDTGGVGVTQVRFDRLGIVITPNSNVGFGLANPDCVSGEENRERTITLITSGNRSGQP